MSLREINREARQRNTTSLQYHFGDRQGLLRAIMDKHSREVNARRNALLDQYEANGVDDIRALASAFVLPLVAKLHDNDGGRCYLRIAAELVNRASRPIEPDERVDPVRPDGPRPARLDHPLEPASSARCCAPIVVGPPLHRRYAAMRFAHIELGRRASERPHQTERLFTSHLVDLVTSVLVTPVSDETAALLAQRRAAARATLAAPATPARRAQVDAADTTTGVSGTTSGPCRVASQQPASTSTKPPTRRGRDLLVEEDRADGHGDGRVDERDQRRAGRADGRDEAEEHDERDRRAQHAEGDDGERSARAGGVSSGHVASGDRRVDDRRPR